MELLLKFQTNSETETSNLGEKIGSILKPGDIVTLTGDLGAGKTHFVAGAAKTLGISDYITSPTFTIVNEYSQGKIPMYHFDLYRLSSYDDLLDIGFEEYADKAAVMFVEWPDCVQELEKIYKNRILQVKIMRRDEISPTRRDIEIRRFDK
ncbi:MAG: tRNA (adenosine(37)-N6)-threonylcarbamoyltransferase complex ATPase subunit type 1 TsaE [Clostridia bacterium]|jgi:tRNA threonylcarbamoyladenosine biosynthesis protein TsaE|nr:tRNA (adenosine(37)-N6)-threonylcarbamoyltransferase complex ATPase subunit type 1 TsaE [Clostridia bacterium]